MSGLWTQYRVAQSISVTDGPVKRTNEWTRD
jgi:hypothetical protein